MAILFGASTSCWKALWASSRTSTTRVCRARPARPPRRLTTLASVAPRHGRRSDQLVNLHHLPAPAFLGEEEVMERVRSRTHTAVAVVANTRVAALPARLFRALVTSRVRSPARAASYRCL